MDAQAAVIAFLSSPASYGAAVSKVDRIETHFSIVFLAGDFAYKLKRAVAWSSLDYVAVDSRRRACQAELRLNRRTAPDLYLSVYAITRAADGALAFDGSGDPIDWVVVMRRFPQSGLLECMAEERRLSPELMGPLAAELARLHLDAERTPQYGGSEGIRREIESNHRELTKHSGLLPAPRVQALRAESLRELAAVSELLDHRRRDGHVRRVHGDLRLANICLYENRPRLFDCIEFSDPISCIDVLYDLAFVLADLLHHDLQRQAETLLERYLALVDEREGLPALPLFLSVRAAMRSYALAGKAEREHGAAARARYGARAQSLLALAEDLLERRRLPFSTIAVQAGSPSRQLQSGVATAPR